MNLHIVADVDAFTLFDRTFNRVQQKLDDLTDVMEAGAQAFLKIMDDRFRAEGYGWKPLKRSYEVVKWRRWPWTLILEASGALRAALTRKGAARQVYEVEAKSATVGTTLPYARMHQYGGGRLPARPIIEFREEDRLYMQKEMQKPLVTFVRRQAFVQTEIGEV
jgi:phage gpG-like protein